MNRSSNSMASIAGFLASVLSPIQVNVRSSPTQHEHVELGNQCPKEASRKVTPNTSAQYSVSIITLAQSCF